MKKSGLQKVLCLVLSLLCLVGSVTVFSACGETTATGDTTRISFSDAVSIDKLKSLNGQTVTIMGYMATLSPVSGKYLYLMNMPYQSCPFCIPNTTQLSNTVAVYAKDGSKFSFTDRAILVTGTMEIGSFTDDYQYTYTYRIKDATYETVDMSNLSDEMKLWYSLSSDGVIADVNSMLDLLWFACAWTEYYVTNDAGEIEYYVFPGDLQKDDGKGYLDDGGYYANSVKTSYYDGIYARVRAVSDTKLGDLLEIVTEAKTLAADAYKEYTDGQYEKVTATDSKEGVKYRLLNEETIQNRYDELYRKYSVWLAKWEM